MPARYSAMLKPLAAVAVLVVTAAPLCAQTQREKRVDMFSNEQVTLACQQYVNHLYPPTTGGMDRTREAVFRACLNRKGR